MLTFWGLTARPLFSEAQPLDTAPLKITAKNKQTKTISNNERSSHLLNAY